MAAAPGSMPFATTEALYQVLGPIFQELIKSGQGVDLVSQARLIIKFRFGKPDGEVLLNCRKKPVEVVCGPSPLRPNLEVTMPAGTLHGILTAQVKLSDAVKTGELKAKGDVLKLMRLAPVLEAASKLYQDRMIERSNDRTK